MFSFLFEFKRIIILIKNKRNSTSKESEKCEFSLVIDILIFLTKLFRKTQKNQNKKEMKRQETKYFCLAGRVEKQSELQQQQK